MGETADARSKAGDVVALVMAGGSGTRFWPASRKAHPKQYLALTGDRPLIAQTVDRLYGVVPIENVHVVSVASQEDLLKQYLPHVTHRILEPQARNTAACLMLSLIELYREGFSRDAVMIALPADHHIGDVDAFRAVLHRAVRVARANRGLVTLGIVPEYAHTGYGYIEAEALAAQADAVPVRRFVEKPDRQRAEAFVRSGNFFWNSGIFIWTLGALEDAFRRCLPAAYAKLESSRSREQLERIYGELEPVPIDIAVLEKSSNIHVIPARMGWSDVGSWSALYQLLRSHEEGNVAVSGELISQDSRGCLVQMPAGKRCALVGVKDLIVVESDGTLLIADMAHDQAVKHVASRLDG